MTNIYLVSRVVSNSIDQWEQPLKAFRSRNKAEAHIRHLDNLKEENQKAYDKAEEELSKHRVSYKSTKEQVDLYLEWSMRVNELSQKDMGPNVSYDLREVAFEG